MTKGSKEPRKKEDTKILFKKSNITMRSRSRTAMSQIKKNCSDKSGVFSSEDGKIKRDFSVETDICMLRRYYKSKRNKLFSREGSYAKSKYSTYVDAEIGTIEEFESDTSGCGDRRQFVEQNAINIDVTSLMMENLKILLNTWIQKHLLEDIKANDTINNILNSIIHEVESRKITEQSSCATYIMDKESEHDELGNDQTHPLSIIYQQLTYNHKSCDINGSRDTIYKKKSRSTVPFPSKRRRIISTLSIPRNFHKQKIDFMNLDSKSKYKPKRDKNYVVTKKSANLFLVLPNIDLVAVPSKPEANKNTINNNTNTKSHNHYRLVFFPHFFNESATKGEVKQKDKKVPKIKTNEFGNLRASPSLVQRMYVGDPANITSTNRNVNYNNKDNVITDSHNILTRAEKETKNSLSISHNNTNYAEKNKTKPIISIDYLKQGLKCDTFGMSAQDSNIPKCPKNAINITKFKKVRVAKNKPRIQGNTSILLNKFHNRQYKHFTYLYKKANSSTSKEKEFVTYLQNIFKNFTDYQGSKNIKLDVHVNVYPMFDKDSKENTLNTYNQDYEINRSTTNVYNVEPKIIDTTVGITKSEKERSSKRQPEIISLLNGASQTKYILQSDNSLNKSGESSKTISNSTQCGRHIDLQISKEISGIRAAIKDIATVAEKLVQQHYKTKNDSNSNEIPIMEKDLLPAKDPLSTKAATVENNKNKTNLNTQKLSKGIQISFVSRKSQTMSGLKFKKEPKNKEDLFNRLVKKSTSYQIIESESILKVTDMTSAATDIKKKKDDIAINMSSKIDTTNMSHKSKLQTFYCQDNNKNCDNLNSDVNHCPLSCHDQKSMPVGRNKVFERKEKLECKMETQENISEPPLERCPTCIIPVEGDENRKEKNFDTEDLLKALELKPKKTSYLKKIMHILVIIFLLTLIAFLVYFFVLKDMTGPQSITTSKQIANSSRIIRELLQNISGIQLRPADLGF